jgi:D-aminopeptidase
VLITDAPLSGLSLRQVAKRAALGIGRGGTPGGNSSGDIFLALSTANPGPMPQHAGATLTKTEINGEQIDPLYLAAVQAVEEAVVNAIVAGEDVATVKPPGHIVPGIDTARLAALF